MYAIRSYYANFLEADADWCPAQEQVGLDLAENRELRIFHVGHRSIVALELTADVNICQEHILEIPSLPPKRGKKRVVDK